MQHIPSKWEINDAVTQCHSPVYPNHQNDCESLRTRMHYHIHKNLLLVSIMNQINPSNLSTINLSHSSHLHSDLWSICSLQPCNHPSVRICLPHKCFVHNLPHPPWINQWRLQNMKILIICCSLNLFNFSPFHQRTSRSLTLLTFTCAAVKVHNILVCFFLGNSTVSEFYMSTFWNTLSVPSS